MTLKGSLEELSLPEVIQPAAVSKRSGMFDLKRNVANGKIFLADGNLVHAQTGRLEGEHAICELGAWSTSDFCSTQGRIRRRRPSVDSPMAPRIRRIGFGDLEPTFGIDYAPLLGQGS